MVNRSALVLAYLEPWSNIVIQGLGKSYIISAKEARKLLGVSGRVMGDDEIEAIVRDYGILARHAVREYLVRK